MAGPPFALKVETHEGLDALVRAIRAEEDGKQLRKELAKNMRTALKPAADAAKASIMSMSSAGLGTSPGLRSSIARKIRPEVKLGGYWSGARVKARKTPNVRGFANAPKRTQRPGGWRHTVWGDRDVWVVQHGKPGWFDIPMQAGVGRYRKAALDAMEDMAHRIESRSR